MADNFQSEEFGTYRLTHLLGKGGMATVYRALREGPHGFTKQVAIKRIHAALNANESILKALINEARLGGQLKHRNIVEIYEFNKVRKEGTDAYYLAMEFVDGWTLDRVVKLGKEFSEPVPPEVVLEMVVQICDGLHYAHTLETLDGEEVRLVHRDLKPANIILARDGTAKIMDFGIAKAATNLYKTTLADTTKGTPHYMSPEQVAGDPNIASVSDIFALGTVIYELVTSKVLFRGDSLVSVLFAVAKAQVTEQMVELDRYMPGLGAIVGRCLAKNPASRYPTAESLSDALSGLRETVGGHGSIRSYLYTLRSHMVAKDRGLQEEATVVEEGPQFATLLGPDWDDMAEEEERAAREMDEARKMADEVMEEVASLRSEPGNEDVAVDQSWLETLPADKFAEKTTAPGKQPGLTPISPRQDRFVSRPGTARPSAVTEVDLIADPDKTRDFPPADPPRNKVWILVAALLLFGFFGVGGIFLFWPDPKPVAQTTPEPTPQGDVVTGLDELTDLSVDETPAPTPRRTPGRTTPRPTATPQATPGPTPAPTAAPTAAPTGEETPPPDLIPLPPPTGETLIEPTTPETVATVDRRPGQILAARGSTSLMVYIDGEFVGNTPIMSPGIQVKAGTHKARLKNPETGEFSPTKTVTVKAGGRAVVPYYNFTTKSWN
jgi:eukaryotic-like serine/threonine-protein kinase